MVAPSEGGDPASQEAESGSASDEVSLSSALPVHALARDDVAAPAEVDAEGLDGGRLGPRWATPLNATDEQ